MTAPIPIPQLKIAEIEVDLRLGCIGIAPCPGARDDRLLHLTQAGDPDPRLHHHGDDYRLGPVVRLAAATATPGTLVAGPLHPEPFEHLVGIDVERRISGDQRT